MAARTRQVEAESNITIRRLAETRRVCGVAGLLLSTRAACNARAAG